jgi:hypothetical protein
LSSFFQWSKAIKYSRLYYSAIFLLATGTVHAQTATIDQTIITPPTPDENSMIALFVTGELEACAGAESALLIRQR